MEEPVFIVEPRTELCADVEEKQTLVEQYHHLRSALDIDAERQPAQQQLPERDDDVHVDERKLQKELEAGEDPGVSHHPRASSLVLFFHDRALVRDVEQELLAVLRGRVSPVSLGYSSSGFFFFAEFFTTLRTKLAWLTCSGRVPGAILFFFTAGPSGLRGWASVCLALFIWMNLDIAFS